MNSYFKFLSRNKLYAAINLVGLTISMAFVLLLAVYVQRQRSTDNFQENADRIFLVGNDENLVSGYWLPKHLKNRYPEIEAATSWSSGNKAPFYTAQSDEAISAMMAYADIDFFDIFSFPLVEGSVTAWKASDHSAVVSRQFANTHFPGESPVGKTLRYGPKGNISELTIAGVVDDFGNSTLQQPEVIVRAELCSHYNSSNNERMSNAGFGLTFVMVRKGADLAAKQEDMLKYMQEINWVYRNGSYHEINLIPLRDIFFLDKYASNYTMGINTGSRSFVNLTTAMCLVLLAFALLNYINLTTALCGRRAKEMATRRLVGAGRWQISLKMIGESTLMCAFALLLAMLLAESLSPAASQLLDYPVSIFKNFSIGRLLLIVAFVLVTGLLAGFIPALIIQRAQPIEVVRGTLRTKTKQVYSKIFIVVQNVVAVVMLVAALAMLLQVRHIINAPLGYNTHHIMVMDNFFGTAANLKPMRDRLMQEPCVKNVAYGEGTPFRGNNNQTMNTADGQVASFQTIKGDSNYFNMLGLQPLQDNHNPHHWWMNEFAMKKFGLEMDAPALLLEKGEITIGGVYKDFKFYDILSDNKEALIYNYGEYPEQQVPWTILVEVEGDEGEAFDKVKSIVHEFYPDDMFAGDYLDNQIAEFFAPQTRLSRLVALFTLLILLVSALGLVAMSTYYMQQERQAVAVRRVFGAETKQLERQLVGTFMRLVLVAFVIATPIAWWVVEHFYLETFSYRIPLYWWIFAIAGIVTLLVALVSVTFQARHTANSNPASILNAEK